MQKKRCFTPTFKPPPQPPFRRVVVTGVGMVTPLGHNVSSTWNHLLSGDCGVSKLPEEYNWSPCKVYADVKTTGPFAFDRKLWVTAGLEKQIPTFIGFTLAAAQEALQDSGWDGDKTRAGVAIGSGFGSAHNIIDDHLLLDGGAGYRKISPYTIPRLLINMASGYVSMRHGFQGPNHAVSTACATGAHSIGDATSFISRGMADVMLAGSSESVLSPTVLAGFARAKSLSTRYNDQPKAASRPFDLDRDGFVMGEGAGVLFLEEYESALARNAKIYGEIRGYGMAGDAYHVTQPTPEGIAAKKCMEMALAQSGLSPGDIGYINAHATSTPIGDISEVNAIKSVFNGHTTGLTVSSIKGAIGHLMGAAGSVEAIATLLALHTGKIPPSINISTLDPKIKCDIDFVENVSTHKNFNAAISNSFGFGGTNVSLLFAKV